MYETWKLVEHHFDNQISQLYIIMTISILLNLHLSSGILYECAIASN